MAASAAGKAGAARPEDRGASGAAGAMIRVAVDAMGGDRGPAVVIEGALRSASDELVPVVFGSSDLDTCGLTLVPTTQVVGMDEKPADAFRMKEDSSLVRAVKAVDDGANADCRAEHLLQFATMGAVFAEEILDIARPSVRLLSIGEEPEKGNQLTLEAHELLTASDLDFRGNAEGRDVLEGAADVLVTDGFTGNVALKAVEGTIRTLLDSLREEITASTTGTVGGLLIRPAARRLRKRLDPDTYGGAYLLGLRGLVVVAHGNSSATAIANAIRLAARGVDHDVVGRLAARLIV